MVVDCVDFKSISNRARAGNLRANKKLLYKNQIESATADVMLSRILLLFFRAV